ncbi:MAG: hypothetical protein ACM3MH_10485 [Actinomycetota bacterium]
MDEYAAALDVCLSLKLIEEYGDVIMLSHDRGKLLLRVYGFSDLGMEFMRACRPETQLRE